MHNGGVVRALSPLLAAIQEQVAGHSAGAAQFDDITVLAARRAGRPAGAGPRDPSNIDHPGSSHR